MPIASYVGSTPISVVEAPIMVMVMNRTFLRPMRSPMRPNTIAPANRATYPTP